MKQFWNDIKDYVFIVIAVLLIRTFLCTPAIVDGSSMDTTLAEGKMVIINKLHYRIKDIKRFDIVVVKNREDKDKIIKRIIGLPNEHIEYKDGKLYINGVLKEAKDVTFQPTEDFEYQTKEGEYFVLGDNRPVSKDSRMLGTFTKKDILGRVKLRLFPFTKIGIVK